MKQDGISYLKHLYKVPTKIEHTRTHIIIVTHYHILVRILLIIELTQENFLWWRKL